MPSTARRSERGLWSTRCWMRSSRSRTRTVGCGGLEELTLEAPLVLPERGGVSVQLSVAAAGADGRRVVSVHSRPADDAEGEWVCHARGVLSVEAGAAGEGLEAWP